MDHLKQTLLISSFVIPLILAITLLVISKHDLPKRVIGIALLNAFYVFLANYFYFYKLYLVYSWGHSLHIATVLWIFPSIYLYVKAIVVDRNSFRKELFHLLPGLIFGTVSAILFYGLLNLDERVYYLSNYRTGTEFSSFNLKIITIFRSADVMMIVVQVIFYSVKFIQLPYKYHERLNEEYSNIENFSISWLKWFNVSFVFVGLLSISFYMFNPFQEKNDLFLIIFLFTISAFIWVVGLWSFKQKKAGITMQPLSLIPVSNQGGVKVKDEELVQKLIDYFEREEPFLQSDLTLTTVCREVGTNRTYLSTVINSSFSMNFNAFVNQYRTQYIKEYLKTKPLATKDELMQVGGFGSLSSLKRALSKSI